MSSRRKIIAAACLAARRALSGRMAGRSVTRSKAAANPRRQPTTGRGATFIPMPPKRRRTYATH